MDDSEAGRRWGTHLTQLREARGLTQLSLAMRVGVVQGAVSNWEGGAVPNWKNMRQIAAALGVPLAEVVAPLDDRSPTDTSVRIEVMALKERVDQLLASLGDDAGE